MNAARINAKHQESTMWNQSMKSLRRAAMTAIASTALLLGLASAPADHAQSDASMLASALPEASVVVGSAVSVSASTAVVALPVALSVDGAKLVVKGVQASAKGTVLLLESASDGAAASIEISGKALRATGASLGDTILVSVIVTGALLSVAGEVIAYVPNEMGKALLYNERL